MSRGGPQHRGCRWPGPHRPSSTAGARATRAHRLRLPSGGLRRRGEELPMAVSTWRSLSTTFRPASNRPSSATSRSCLAARLLRRRQRNGWAQRDSNPRPLPCKGSALPTELYAPERDAEPIRARGTRGGDRAVRVWPRRWACGARRGAGHQVAAVQVDDRAPASRQISIAGEVVPHAVRALRANGRRSRRSRRARRTPPCTGRAPRPRRHGSGA